MLIVYFGADAGCGCTMLTQCTANYMAQKNPDKNVLFLSLSGYSGTDYANAEFNYSLDDLQIKLKSNVLTIEELKSMCSVRKNLYMLQGSSGIKQRKEYMPEDITKLIEMAAKQFDYIVADAGSSIDLGIGLGALNCKGMNILVTTQSQRAFTRYMHKRNIFNNLEIFFSKMIVNKFVSKHFLPSVKLIEGSYKMDNCYVIDYSDYGMQAENEGSSLDYLDKSYKRQIEDFIEELIGFKNCNKRTFRSSILGRLRGEANG